VAKSVRHARGHCPVLTLGRDTAELRGEWLGVWGGRNFTRRIGSPRFLCGAIQLTGQRQTPPLR
jgi:hypothetical protein